MKYFLDGNELTERGFNKVCRANLLYDEYKCLIEQGEYVYREYIKPYSINNYISHKLVIGRPNGMREFDIYTDGMVGAEKINFKPILAESRHTALKIYIEKYGDDESRMWGVEHNVMTPYEFEGYSSAEDMFNDLYPARPVEL